MKNVSEEEKQKALSFLMTEHTTLQAARSNTIFDSSGRTTLYLNTVSSSVVALAFIGQISKIGMPFFVFALLLLPALFIIGLFTFMRVLQSGVEDYLYARGMNRIRHYFLETAPHAKDYLILSAHDDGIGTMRNMGIKSSPIQLMLTTASMVSFVNSILLGVFTGLSLYLVFNWTIFYCILPGIFIFILGVVIHYWYQKRKWAESDDIEEVIFPSPKKKEE